MPDTVQVALAIGSNLGDRTGHIVAALTALAALRHTRIVTRSELHETVAVGLPGSDPGGPYLNAAAVLETRLAPLELLEALHGIERSRGRDRSTEKARWLARPLDLDILLYGNQVVNLPGLTIPHPRMHQRRFVLGPLATIAPDWRVPTVGRTVRELLEALGPDQSP